jgi:hypothetical protein
MTSYALERGGCWHEVTERDGDRWTAACGVTGEPYRGEPGSVTVLAVPPSPLHCRSTMCAHVSERDRIGWHCARCGEALPDPDS